MRYRVHRIKESAREAFRWSSHTGGTAIVKAKDYEAGEELEAISPYAAWKSASTTEQPLQTGDVLEQLDESGNPTSVLIAKYIGFEPAAWFVPAPKIDATPEGTERSAEAAMAAQPF